MNKYWFRKRQGLKTKDLGWGWIPISWEGWLVILLFFALIGIFGYILGIFKSNVPTSRNFVFLTGLLLLIGVATTISHNRTRP